MNAQNPPKFGSQKQADSVFRRIAAGLTKLTKLQLDAIYSLGSQPALRSPTGERTLRSLRRRGLTEIRHEYAPVESHWRLTEKGREAFKREFC